MLIRLLGLMAGKDTNFYASGLISEIRTRVRVRMVLPVLLVLMTVVPGAATAVQAVDGKAIVMERSRGNCLACHAIADGKLPGTLGPPLIGMKARFPDADTLRMQVWDATKRNPDTRMPPFGRHGILSSEEIDLVVQYLYTL